MPIVGTFGNDLLIGANGADSIQGSFGNDELRGLGGNDVLSGGGDNDRLEGGSGDDQLYGGDGNDTAVFVTASAVTVDLSGTWSGDGTAHSAVLGDDDLYSIENIVTYWGADTIYGNDVANTIVSGSGNDTVRGYGGADVIDAQSGHDTVYGGVGHDTIWGGSGNDSLYGDQLNDFISGGSGNDVIHAGYDDFDYWGNFQDILTGGADADTFVFGYTSGTLTVGAGNRDIIMDFEPAEGDKIDLTALRDDYGDQLEFVGDAAFTDANQLRFSVSGNTTIVQVNFDINLAADGEIELLGVIGVTAGDFLL